VVLIGWAGGKGLGIVIRKALAFEAPYPTTQSETGIAIGVALLGVAISQVGALFYEERGREYLAIPSRGFFYYEGGNLLVLGVISGMLRATKLNKSGVPFRTFNGGTRAFLLWVGGWVLLVGMILIPIAGYAGEFPTHSPPTHLEVTETGPYDFKLRPFKGLYGLEFKTIIDPSSFPGGKVPESLNLKLVFAGDLNADWRLSNSEIVAEIRNVSRDVWVKRVGVAPTSVYNEKYWNGGGKEVIVMCPALNPDQPVRLTFRMIARRRENGLKPALRNAALSKLKESITILASVPLGLASK